MKRTKYILISLFYCLAIAINISAMKDGNKILGELEDKSNCIPYNFSDYYTWNDSDELNKKEEKEEEEDYLPVIFEDISESEQQKKFFIPLKNDPLYCKKGLSDVKLKFKNSSQKISQKFSTIPNTYNSGSKMLNSNIVKFLDEGIKDKFNHKKNIKNYIKEFLNNWHIDKKILRRLYSLANDSSDVLFSKEFGIKNENTYLYYWKTIINSFLLLYSLKNQGKIDFGGCEENFYNSLRAMRTIYLSFKKEEIQKIFAKCVGIALNNIYSIEIIDGLIGSEVEKLFSKRKLNSNDIKTLLGLVEKHNINQISALYLDDNEIDDFATSDIIKICELSNKSIRVLSLNNNKITYHCFHKIIYENDRISKLKILNCNNNKISLKWCKKVVKNDFGFRIYANDTYFLPKISQIEDFLSFSSKTNIKNLHVVSQKCKGEDIVILDSLYDTLESFKLKIITYFSYKHLPEEDEMSYIFFMPDLFENCKAKNLKLPIYNFNKYIFDSILKNSNIKKIKLKKNYFALNTTYFFFKSIIQNSKFEKKHKDWLGKININEKHTDVVNIVRQTLENNKNVLSPKTIQYSDDGQIIDINITENDIILTTYVIEDKKNNKIKDFKKYNYKNNC